MIDRDLAGNASGSSRNDLVMVILNIIKTTKIHVMETKPNVLG